MKDRLQIQNKDTHEVVDCGLIVDERVIGRYKVWLTYDDGDKIWWIVIQPAATDSWRMGYREAREKECREVFNTIMESEIAECLAAYPSGYLRRRVWLS